MTTSWDTLAAGQGGCPFDAPRAEHTAHWDLVAGLSVSSWYLPHNQMYRGHGILVFDPRHVTRLDELTSVEWQSYAADLHRAVRAIGSVCKPDHFNVESLGNIVPHLHWHVIPRYKNDGRWGQPIWAPDVSAQPERRLATDDRERLLVALRTAVSPIPEAPTAEEASNPPIG
ncbi:MAG TPA: HIT family protein [Gammaproteobacteria bacterium]|nr:HIT family protein [Gammaproteobacteria bacterium]